MFFEWRNVILMEKKLGLKSCDRFAKPFELKFEIDEPLNLTQLILYQILHAWGNLIAVELLFCDSFKFVNSFRISFVRSEDIHSYDRYDLWDSFYVWIFYHIFHIYNSPRWTPFMCSCKKKLILNSFEQCGHFSFSFFLIQSTLTWGKWFWTKWTSNFSFHARWNFASQWKHS